MSHTIPAQATAPSKLKFGIIGTGLMASIYTEILQQRTDCEVKAVVGNTDDKTLKFAKKYGLVPFSGAQYFRMFDEVADIDAVIVATPEWAREAPLGSVVRRKKHVLLEKPFAADLKTTFALKSMLENYPAVFQVCHVLRYSPRFCAMADVVKAGEIGQIRQIYARRNSNQSRVMRVLGKSDLAYWLTPHDLDIMNWITGAHVDKVYAVSRAGLTAQDDYLIANLHFSNGVDAVLENSWSSPAISGEAREALFEVRGTQGVIELDDADMNVRVYKSGGVVETPNTYEDYQVQGMRRGFFENLISHFVERVKKNDVSGDALDEAVETSRVCAMIRQSLTQGRVVERHEPEFQA